MLDTRIVNSGGHGVAIFKSCEALGIQYITQEQMVPFSITWNRQVTSIKVSAENQVTILISGIQVVFNLALNLQTNQAVLDCTVLRRENGKRNMHGCNFCYDILIFVSVANLSTVDLVHFGSEYNSPKLFHPG